MGSRAGGTRRRRAHAADERQRRHGGQHLPLDRQHLGGRRVHDGSPFRGPDELWFGTAPSLLVSLASRAPVDPGRSLASWSPHHPALAMTVTRLASSSTSAAVAGLFPAARTGTPPSSP